MPPAGIFSRLSGLFCAWLAATIAAGRRFAGDVHHQVLGRHQMVIGEGLHHVFGRDTPAGTSSRPRMSARPSSCTMYGSSRASARHGQRELHLVSGRPAPSRR